MKLSEQPESMRQFFVNIPPTFRVIFDFFKESSIFDDVDADARNIAAALVSVFLSEERQHLA